MNGSEYSRVNLPMPEPERPFTWHDAAAPLLALALSALYWDVFGMDQMVDSLPGIGIPVFVAAFFIAVLVITGIHIARESAFLKSV